jgi:hypothetical protein
MQPLNLPDHGVKTKQTPEGGTVFDPVRRKWVILTPEEWVRQHFLQFLVNDLRCPASLIAVERSLTLHGLSKRADLVVHATDGSPLALVECKAPAVKLDQAVFEQAARYNIVFRVAYLFVTNGLQHFCCRVDHSTGAVHFLPELPGFGAMTGTDRA